MQGERWRDVSGKEMFFKLEIDLLRAQLKGAEESGKYANAVEISIPSLSGKMERFRVYSQPVMVKELADQYQLGSYAGVSIENPSKMIRFSLAPNDFQAMIMSDGGYEFIEPANKDKSVYRVYPKTKFSGDKPFVCSTEENVLSKKEIAALYSKGKSFQNNPTNFAKNNDKKYRTLRLAISTTGEYTAFFGGVANALVAVNATLTRVNGVFEKDFALRLIMQNYPAIIYPNAATDPYTGNLNLQLQQTLTTVVGNANYDIGHVFNAAGGNGNAGCIGCICIDPTAGTPAGKGSAFTQSNNPQGDTFDIDYVAHEIGHQLGANHTFAHSLEGTGVNMEPGSGSTIMGYAGITGPNTDVQNNSDPYFHVASITQVQANLIAKTCDIETNVVNDPPVIAALPTYNIPKGTAFVLTGSATDAQNDPLTYTWEEVDDAAIIINNANLGNTTSGASFRSVLPTATGNVRYFPRLTSVLAGVLNNANSMWEAVSTVPRQQRFALTVRDNSPNAQQQQTSNAVQTINVGNDGPFKVTSTTVYNNSAGAVTWDVVNTTAAPYSVANVKIDYTTNNGATWNIISNSTPNDGAEPFQFTGLAAGSTVKIRVASIGNVFYAIGQATVAAMQACSTTPPTPVTVSSITITSATVQWTPTTNATYNLQYKKVTDPTWTVVTGLTSNTYTINGLAEGTQYEVQVASICAGTTGAYSASTNFTTLSVTYCPAASQNFTDEYISNVTVTPTGAAVMSNNSAGSTYTSYVADPSKLINLVIGSAGNQVSVSKFWAGPQYNEGVSVWIDFNRNGVFEASERVMNSAASTVTPVTATFTVPAAAYSGGLPTRMRVMLTYADAAGTPAPADPCAVFAYGEVEDYAVVLQAQASNCIAPSGLAVSAVGSSTATISWTAANPVPGVGYEYYISTTNTAPSATTPPSGTATGTTVNLTNLLPYTTYYFWVRSACSATEVSTWTGGPSFTTQQVAANLPYQQPFNTVNDWIFINGTQTNKWHYGAAAGNPPNALYVSNDNGVTNAYTNNSSSVVHAYRDFVIPAGSTMANFSFDWKSIGEGNWDYLRVWLVPASFTPVAGTQITAGGGRVQIGGNFEEEGTWQTYFNPTLSVAAFAGQTMRVVLSWRNDGIIGDNPPAAVDNINIQIPLCQVPTNLNFNTITQNSATITWTAANPAPANGYQYYISTTNTPPTPTTAPSGSSPTNSAVLTGLTPNTVYYFWVRSNCGGTNGTSLWMTGPSFTTGQVPAQMPYYQPFNNMDMTVVNGNQVNKWFYGGAAGNPANSLYITNDNGVTNAYTTNSTTVAHAYRDIVVPAGTTLATLMFDWRAVGEGTTWDYLRVWLVPTTFTPVAGTQIAAGGGRIQIGGNLNQQANWQTYFDPTVNLTSFAGQTVRLVFSWRNDGGGGTQPPAAIDNINLSVPACQVPTNIGVTNITSTSAQINWTAANPAPANGYQYYITSTGVPPTPTTAPTGAAPGTSLSLTNLSPNTDYCIWIRSNCGGAGTSFWMPGPCFTTTQIPAPFPYVQPFDNGPVDFSFVNGTQTNKWFYGGAAGNPPNSIYVTNDNGVTNAYTNNSASVVHAYRDIAIPAGTTNIIFSFDWRAVGQNNWDYLRVWLVPTSYMPPAGTQITAGGGRVQVGNNFGLQDTWQQYMNMNLNVGAFAGQTMRLVFSWRNNGSIGTNPPAAVDNVRLARCSNDAPNFTITNITNTSAVVSWPQDAGGASYIFRYREVGAANWITIPIASAFPAPTVTYNLTNLSAVTQYEVEVAAICEGVQGAFGNQVFETRCDPAPPTNLIVSQLTPTSAVVTWDPVLSATYILEWREVGAPAWTTVNLTATTYNLNNLTPNTNYEVRVASVCSGATNPYTTPVVFTTPATCDMAPTGLTVTNITMTQAQVDWNAFPGATYVLRYRKVGTSNWNTVTLTNNTYLLTGLTEVTQYEIQVANICSGTQGTFTPPYVFTTPSVIYCNMSSNSSANEFISNVKVTPNGKPEMNNDSQASNYSDFTGAPDKVIELVQGSTGNQISVSKSWVGTNNPEAVTVWIDFNRDGTFANNERILISPASTSSPVTGTFDVPADAFVSLTNDKYIVMRVALRRNAAPPMCSDFDFGEVEDYKVRISKPFPTNIMNPDQITVYPNPAKHTLFVTRVKDGAKYSIYNSVGQLVKSSVIVGNKIDLSPLINGVYVIDITDTTGESAQIKFIKE